MLFQKIDLTSFSPPASVFISTPYYPSPFSLKFTAEAVKSVPWVPKGFLFLAAKRLTVTGKAAIVDDNVSGFAANKINHLAPWVCRVL